MDWAKKQPFKQWNNKYKGPNSGNSLLGPSNWQRAGITIAESAGESAWDEFVEVGRSGPWRPEYEVWIPFYVNGQPSKTLKQGSDMILFLKEYWILCGECVRGGEE